MTKSQRKLWIGLFVMALLTPLGIVLPHLFNAGAAWGEWGVDKLEQLLGYTPQGLKKLSDLWKAPVPNYSFGGRDASMTLQIISYVASGVLGVLAVALAVFLISRFMAKNDK
ncbi:MAG: PDGLE domain-containing protein [Deltaproteobacteria bacterium]|jgi:cobalt/nickel transport protein